MANVKERFLTAYSEEGFHRLCYSEWGQHNPGYAPIICIHGLTRNRGDFNALAEFLSSHGRHVFCLDVVGRGDSDWLGNAKHYQFLQYVNDVNTLVARIDSEHVDIIGTSMGGIIGMMMAADAKTMVHRLVMNDVGPQVPVKALWRLAKYAGKSPVFKSSAEAKSYFKEVYADFGIERDEDWDNFTEYSIYHQDDGYHLKLDPEIKNARHGSHFFKELVYHPHKALEGIIFDVDMWAIWEKVHCPVMVIRGERSDLLLPEYVQKMQELHSDTLELLIPNAGHAPALLKSEEHEAILDWLDLPE